jgi:hypothetical protein
MASDFIHGTIDVVLMTREGFALATDSRVTHSDGTYSDDQQKAFVIGGRVVCVIAGVIGSEIGVDGFRLRDAIASHLAVLNSRASSLRGHLSALEVARTFEHGFQGVVGLLNPGTRSTPSIVAGVSIVSVSSEGEPEWTTFYLPIDMRSSSEGGPYLTTGAPFYLYHPLNLGLRFDIEAIGYPEVVRVLVRADSPGSDAYSSSEIMRKFYALKAEGRLDQLRLAEAAELARTLVDATIALAPPGAGVGGPVDVITVSRDGVTWLQKKHNPAPIPPPYRLRLFSSSVSKGRQELDGLECVRCTFTDVDFTYRGDADVQLIGCEFEGSCKLTLSDDAMRKNPRAVQRLRKLLSGKCEVIEEKPK